VCDDDSVRAAVVSTCRVVAEADWSQRLGMSKNGIGGSSSSTRRSLVYVRSGSNLDAQGIAGSSSLQSSFRCEIIRKFASVIGIWGLEDGSFAPPELTRVNVG
jgi:hypothetical protein